MSDTNSIASIDTIDAYQRILAAEISAIDSVTMMSNTATATSPQLPHHGSKHKKDNNNNNNNNNGGRLSPKSLALAEAIAVVDSDTAAVSSYYNSLSSNELSHAPMETSKKGGDKKTAPLTAAAASLNYRRMKRERIEKLEEEGE